jgi:hypothetical protein
MVTRRLERAPGGKRMNNVTEVKEALSARSHTTTLSELASRGRKRVRVIKADDVAAMIAEAVNTAVAASNLIEPAEVEQLVARSRSEFQNLLAEREREVTKAREMLVELDTLRDELKRARAEQSEAADAARRAIDERDRARAQLLDTVRARDGAQTELRQAISAHAAEIERLAKEPPSPVPAMASPVGTELVYKMMTEIAELKASRSASGAAAAVPLAAAAGVDVAGAIEKLAGTLNERLESFGRKIGVSSAVEADQVNLDALFKHGQDTQLESNMDSIEVKAQTGGGIAANLARLKKLKGG